MEEWKEIKGFKGMYEISNIGRVKSYHKNNIRILKGRLDKGGYEIVHLYKNKTSKNYKVHQLVSIAFLGHVQSGHYLVINHINHKRNDNRVCNLEIVTPRENNSKRLFKGTSKYTGVCWDKSKNKWFASININGKTKNIGKYDNELEASNAYQEQLKIINHV